MSVLDSPAAQRGRARMLISCPDRPGIVAAVSRFLFEHGANIVQSDQHSTDPQLGRFFMRIEFDLEQLGERLDLLERDFASIAERFELEWRIVPADRPKRVAVMVSRQDHCLMELLWQWRARDLDAEIAMVISNHPDARESVEGFGIPFYHIPVGADKAASEAEQLAVMEDKVDLVVLARYMQILSADFIGRFPHRIINIHHSFLPAFVGGKPYERAYERGVKIIGATAHYATAELDAGPIIEQDVQRVNHRDNVDALKRIGRNIERVVLARAVKWHVEERVLVYENKTVVFS